jgi:glycosyltransferase involved in cell wall biosynthesis
VPRWTRRRPKIRIGSGPRALPWFAVYGAVCIHCSGSARRGAALRRSFRRSLAPAPVQHPFEQRPLRVALVLWSGKIGGAETVSVELARAMARAGAAPSMVFVLRGDPLANRLAALEIPCSELGLDRGRSVLLARRRLADAVSRRGADAAILVGSGYLAAALRVGGYGGPIVGVEHGSLLQLGAQNPLTRLIRTLDRVSGVKACSAIVAVSPYMKDRVDAHRPRARVVCIPNGVDLKRFSPPKRDAGTRRADGHLVIGCAARLVEGKGVGEAIEALAHPALRTARLRLAGIGPLQETLREIAQSHGVATRTEFLGEVLDMPTFWRSVDVALTPSTVLIESFGMAAVEAMACGRPVVASDNGALPSIVADGQTGRVVPPGDVLGLSAALADYANDADLRASHGRNGRLRCEKRFGIEQTAQRYLELCADLIRERGA